MERLGSIAAGTSAELQGVKQRSGQLSRTTEARAQLASLVEQMTAGFPHQEWEADTMKIWRLGFEELVRRHGIEQLRVALQSFLTRQKWFPHPSEVSEVLDEMATKRAAAARKALPKIGCDVCANEIGMRGYLVEQHPGQPRYLRPCACRIEYEKAKRELEGVSA